MQTTNIDIQIIKNDFHADVDLSTLDNVIFADNSDELHVVSQITLSGKYNGVYNVVSFIEQLTLDTICLDEDVLLIAIAEQVAVVDLKQDKLICVLKLDYCGSLFNICKFKSGYFIHGECSDYFWIKILIYCGTQVAQIYS